MSMPKQRPGKSVQTYGTPPELLKAIKDKLSINGFLLDLAASKENRVAGAYYTEEMDALSNLSWTSMGWAWCNPPYADITPWVKKAYEECTKGAKVAMLVPASVGSNWWSNWVDGKAQVLFLRPRLTFVGCIDPYPKDCAILLYTKYNYGSYECWNWRTE